MQATISAKDVNELKKAPPVEGVLPAIHERWSPRSFADRAVSSNALQNVFEAARWAPSSANEQPWRYLVGRRGDATWQKIFDTLADGNKKWAHNAPVLILATALTRFSRNGTENKFALHDLGAASAYLVLETAVQGMRAHQMAGFDHDAARKAFGIPDEYLIGSVIALGYQGEPTALGDQTLIERETAARTRKAVNEIAFSEWEKPAEL